MKNKDADNDSPDSSDASPDGIGNADGDSLCGFCQKHCTQHIKHGKARNPEPILRTNCEFGLAEAKSEACFTEARYDKNNPVHGRKTTKKIRNQAFARVADYLLYNYNYKTIFFVILHCRYHLVLFNGLRRNRMKHRENVKKESRLFI